MWVGVQHVGTHQLDVTARRQLDCADTGIDLCGTDIYACIQRVDIQVLFVPADVV